jgi:hypothetical protein
MSNMHTETATSDTINAFLRLPWHDSELLGWSAAYGGSDEPIVTLEIVFRDSGNGGGRAEVRFNEARGIYADIDLLAKKLCGDQIASGNCMKAEDATDSFVHEMDARFDLYRGETLSGLFLFTIKLIHPAGEILVLARSFSLAQRDS